ncbi:MAG TPA: hybrid sensor histidine kinase/response regulator [Anaerolineae bacterium]
MPPCVMVIDDNPDMTQLVALLLRSRSYEVMTALSGEEGLAAMEQRRPDVVICDIMMPGLTGFDVFQRMRADQRWRALPFVFLTALADSQTRLSSTELGAEAFITKPFNSQELLSVVAGLLRRAAERQSYTESEMDSFKEQLLFMITHELNTPLSVIRMLTDSMRNGFSRLTRLQIAEYLELMARSTNDLSAIVESMLLALQIDSGRAQVLFTNWGGPHVLRSAVQEVLGRAAAKAKEREVTIQTAGMDQVLWIRAHDQQLAQMLSRVLDNAIQFSPKRGTVIVRQERRGEWATVTFSDQGPGMKPEEIESAFTRLHQVNRAQQEQQGVGLSLSLVRSLATIHGGQITVESTPGRGSSFRLALPLIDPPI